MASYPEMRVDGIRDMGVLDEGGRLFEFLLEHSSVVRFQP
jgi:hypothetical protein